MRLIVLSGDGIGPEIVSSALAVLEAASTRFDLGLVFDHDEVGFPSLEKHGTTLTDKLLERARTYDGILLGPQSNADYPPPAEGGRNITAAFRTKLDLYANVRPARTRPAVPTHMPAGKTMDLVIMREATEGFYADRNMARGSGEMMPSPDIALAMRKISRHGSERIARQAFELAARRRRKVTAIHKANCFLMTCGLFLEACRDVAKDFPGIEYEEMIVDAAAAHLVRSPDRFDVLCATNLFGDILSDLVSELSGSIGTAGSINASDTLCCAQAQHGSAPDIQGRDIANPTSMILSSAMLLDWLARRHGRPALAEAAAAIETAIDTVLENSETRTRDLGGPLGTRAFTGAVVKAFSG